MPLPDFSLAVVGAPYSNKDGSNREFEILLCHPGEVLTLIPEPRNRYDEHAVAVNSGRNVQIGYINSERAPQIGSLLRAGHEVAAIFQEKTRWGCIIRIGVDAIPTLPKKRADPSENADPFPDYDSDYIPPDDL